MKGEDEMSEFEKELLNKVSPHDRTHNGNELFLGGVLAEHFEDWQPPKPLVVVPQIVARYIETEEDNDYNRVGTLVYGHYTADDRGEKHSELHEWIAYNFDTFLKAIVNGYTVKKEQLFYLKNKNTGHILYRQPKEAGGNLIEVVATINEEYTWFTQDEIDTMHTGSYEKIEVDQ